MTEKSILIDMHDPRAGKIAEVLANKTCMKILSVLAEKQMSESEISKELNLPLNTIGYNIKKLVESGLVTAGSQLLWSVKGKRVSRYEISRKRIIISPRESFRGVLPAIFATIAAALGIKAWQLSHVSQAQIAASQAATQIAPSAYSGTAQAGTFAAQKGAEIAASSSDSATQIYSTFVNTGYSWLWFLLGALACIIIILVWNWRKLW